MKKKLCFLLFYFPFFLFISRKIKILLVFYSFQMIKVTLIMKNCNQMALNFSNNKKHLKDKKNHNFTKKKIFINNLKEFSINKKLEYFWLCNHIFKKKKENFS